MTSIQNAKSQKVVKEPRGITIFLGISAEHSWPSLACYRLVLSQFFDIRGNLTPVHWLKKSDYSSLACHSSHHNAQDPRKTGRWHYLLQPNNLPSCHERYCVEEPNRLRNTIFYKPMPCQILIKIEDHVFFLWSYSNNCLNWEWSTTGNANQLFSLKLELD